MEIQQSVQATTEPEVHRFRFEGKTGEMFLLMVVNFILTAATIGIYRFWATTKTRKYLWSHLSFHGDRLEYSGTGKELFNSAMKVGSILILLVIIGNAATTFLGEVFRVLTTLVFYGFFFFIIPFAQYSGRNYRLSRTRFRGIRFGMGKARLEYMKAFWLWTILMPLSFYVLTPIRWIKLQSIMINNTHFGSKNLRFSGKSDDIFGQYLLNLFLTTITLGIYYPWHKAWLLRYQWQHTHVGDARFDLKLSGKDLFLVYIENILAIILTLGLAAPWAIKNYLEFFFYRLAIVGPLNLEQIAQAQSQTSAVGEEIADFLDVDFGF